MFVVLAAVALLSVGTFVVQPAHALLYVYVPEKMIAGQSYRGAVISDVPSSEMGGSLVHLATGSPTVEIPRTTVIPLGKNHGLFEIDALRGGLVEVHAAYNGEVGLGGGTVFDASTGPQALDLILATNKTSASDLGAFVFLLDGNGYPTAALTDMSVRLVPTGLIQTPHSIVIKEGDTHAAFPIHVSGSGLVTAASAGLTMDVEHIQYEVDLIRVRLSVAPDVVLPGGMLDYTMWLERLLPNGQRTPYYPPHTIRAELQTTNTDVVRLTETPPAHRDDNTLSVTLREGQATGIIYAGHPLKGGFAALTAVVPGYGVATTGVCVGTIVFEGAVQKDVNDNDNSTTTATVDDAQTVTVGSSTNTAQTQGSIAAAALDTGGCSGSSAETYTEYLERLNTQRYESADEEDGATTQRTTTHSKIADRLLDEAPPINYVRLWIHPDVSSLHARGTIGFYHLEGETTRTTSFGENGTILQTETNYEKMTPVRADGYQHVTVSAAPSGSIHMQSTHITHPTHHTNAYTFPLTAVAEGVYSISATAVGYTHTDTLTVTAPYELTYHLGVTPLPVSSVKAGADDDKPPLFLVTITDSAGRTIDVRDEFGVSTRQIRVQFGDGTTEQILIGAQNTGVIYGIQEMLLPSAERAAQHKELNIVATLEGAPGASAAYGSVTPVGIPVSVEIDVPPIVHAGELFPVSVHTVDSAGIPVARVQTVGTTTGFAVWDDQGLGAVHNIATAHKDINTALVGLLHTIGGGAQASITTFLNEMSLAVEAPTTVPAGVPFTIRADVSTDATRDTVPHTTYEITTIHAGDSDGVWRHNQTSAGIFEIFPTTEGDATITIRATTDGFHAQETTIQIHSEMAVLLDVQAVSDSAVDTQLQVDFTNQNGTILTTPYRTILTEPQLLSFGFPKELESRHGLIDVQYEGALHIPGTGLQVRPGDASIKVVATYESRIQIFVSGGSGTGIYPYGAPVLVVAEPGSVVPYLIPERLAYWEGAPDQPAEFITTAHRHTEYEAVYEPDYTRLLYVVGAAVAISTFFVYMRFAAAISYRLGSLFDGLRP